MLGAFAGIPTGACCWCTDRVGLIQKHNIADTQDPCWNFCLMAWCAPCAIAQELNHVQAKGMNSAQQQTVIIQQPQPQMMAAAPLTPMVMGGGAAAYPQQQVYYPQQQQQPQVGYLGQQVAYAPQQGYAPQAGYAQQPGYAPQQGYAPQYQGQ